MIRRTLEPRLRRAADMYPVVTLTGPRQSGKTTLARHTFPEHDYVSLEEPDQQSFAREDPRGFLDQFPDKAVLDEVQRVPTLFSYIQTLVDSEDKPGRFILTGSQNFLLLQTISQTLAGRCAILHLMPFSLSELEGRESLGIEKIGMKLPRKDRLSERSLMETLFQGFYPRIHDKGLDPADWLAHYYRTYVERDVREVLNVGDLESFGRFIRLCAGRNGQLLNLSSLGNDAGVGHTTVRRWISVLEASFLVFLLRPYHRSFNKRLIKSPKLYVLDTGLLCYLLRIRSPEDLRLHGSRGGVFESFVVAEIIKDFLNRGQEPDLFFWRDSAGHEIDTVIEGPSGAVPVEVKSGQTFSRDFLSGIRFWKDMIGEPDAPSAVVYGGDSSFRREGVPVYSWSCL